MAFSRISPPWCRNPLNQKLRVKLKYNHRRNVIKVTTWAGNAGGSGRKISRVWLLTLTTCGQLMSTRFIANKERSCPTDLQVAQRQDSRVCHLSLTHNRHGGFETLTQPWQTTHSTPQIPRGYLIRSLTNWPITELLDWPAVRTSRHLGTWSL